jgi:DNA-binding winged helix-turn-helix (wHTH) protein
MSLETHYFEFGEFLLDAGEKVLLRQGKPVQITPKVFQMLLVLIENHGRIVEKNKLMELVWTDSFVEESNLTFTMRQLTKKYWATTNIIRVLSKQLPGEVIV